MQGMKRMVKNTVTPGVHARDEENDTENEVAEELSYLRGTSLWRADVKITLMSPYKSM